MTKYLGNTPFSVGGYSPRSLHPYTTLVWDYKTHTLTITTNVEPPRILGSGCCKRERLEEPELHWKLVACARHASEYLEEYG
jgi:hypothetical protein